MSNTLKQQIAGGENQQEIEPQSPSQIFKIESETAKEHHTQDQTLESQINNRDSNEGIPTSQLLEQSKSPKALLAAKKQNSVQGQGEFNSGRWSVEEHNLFLEALRIHGKNWDKIQKHVKTRCVQNIRSHSQKFNEKLKKLVDAEGNLLEGVDRDKEVLAGVDNHGSAPYYFNLLMKRTKKDALKKAQNQSTPTNNSQRPRLGSYESINSQGLSNQIGNASSADSQEEQDMNKSQKSQEKVTSQDREDMMEMEFEQSNGNINFQVMDAQNQSDPDLQNSNQGNRNLYDTRQPLNHQMDPSANQEIIQFGNCLGDRNSFRTHNRNKLNEALNIDNRIKMSDHEIPTIDNDYFFQALVDRETEQSKQKKESFKTTRDFVQANLMYNGLSSIDERLKGSRFNFQQSNDFSKEFLRNQLNEQNDFQNQLCMDINSTEAQVNTYPQHQVTHPSPMQPEFQAQPLQGFQQEVNSMEYTHFGGHQQYNPLQNNNFVDTLMGSSDIPSGAVENNAQMDVAEDVVMQTMII